MLPLSTPLWNRYKGERSLLLLWTEGKKTHMNKLWVCRENIKKIYSFIYKCIAEDVALESEGTRCVQFREAERNYQLVYVQWGDDDDDDDDND